MTKKYNFNEKETEKGKNDDGVWIDMKVWQSPKYIQSKEKAIELIEEKEKDYRLNEGDFWILMNKSKNNKMIYTGLIISHNGCLKINDKLDDELKFDPESVKFVKDDQEKVMSYVNKNQGIYEFGEVSRSNCKNQYPYAMVLKRLMDRVILKNSKIGFYGIYSEAESDEFKEKPEAKTPKKDDILESETKNIAKKISNSADEDMKETMEEINKNTAESIKDALKKAKSRESLNEIYEEYKPDMTKLYKYNRTLFNEVKEHKENLYQTLPIL